MSELHLKQKFHFPVNHFGLKSGEQLKSLLLTEAVWLCRESETSVLSVEHCPVVRDLFHAHITGVFTDAGPQTA